MNMWLVMISLLCPQGAVARKLAREVVEAFGREAVERAEPRIAALVEAHGDEVVRVLRKVGPAGVEALERHGLGGMRLLSKWGDDGLRVLASHGDDAVEFLGRYGDPAVELLARHPGVGRDLIENFGSRALRQKISTESVVALNRLAVPIRSSGRADEILDVVERFGDRACAFLWRNKGTIFLTGMMAAFLCDPQPYLDGAKRLVVEPAVATAREVVGRTRWTIVGAVIVVWMAAGWMLGRRRSLRSAGKSP